MQRGGLNAVAELRSLWQRWTRIVEMFARRQRARRRVDPEVYENLHRDILDCCASLSEMVDDEERLYLESLAQLALPWVTTQSFKQADRDILADLFNRCRAVDRELSGRLWSMPDWRKPLRPLLFLLSGAAIVAVMWTLAAPFFPHLSLHPAFPDAVTSFLERYHYGNVFLVPSVVIIAVSSYMVSRTVRY